VAWQQSVPRRRWPPAQLQGSILAYQVQPVKGKERFLPGRAGGGPRRRALSGTVEYRPCGLRQSDGYCVLQGSTREVRKSLVILLKIELKLVIVG